jgi:hypothetical protein
MLSSIEFSASKAVEEKKKFEKQFKCKCTIKGEAYNKKPLYRVCILEDVIPF